MSKSNVFCCLFHMDKLLYPRVRMDKRFYPYPICNHFPPSAYSIENAYEEERYAWQLGISAIPDNIRIIYIL